MGPGPALQNVMARCPAWALFLVTLAFGAGNALCFAPLGWWPLQLVAHSWLFLVVFCSPTVRHAMQWTWLYCFAWLFAGVIWLTVTMFRYGDMPVWLSIVCVALFSAALALIPMLLMGFAARLRQRFVLTDRIICLVAMPTAWTLAEWTRGWIFTGFPWLVSGYAHNVSVLAGYAPVIGVYGISWLVALIAGSVVLVLHRHKGAVVLIGLIGVGGIGLQSLQWTAPHGQPLTVRLLQGNIDQQIKFEQEHLADSLRFYFDAIVGKPADLIVTPESAIPLPQQALPPGYLDQLRQFAHASHSVIALGLFSSDGPDLYANSMISLAPDDAAQVYRYDKHHLVPFGEFIPKGFGWFYHYMNIPMGDLQRGPLLAAPFPVRDQQILPNICYEDVFGEEIAERISFAHRAHRPEPTILLNMTNLSWFGDTWAMPQHVQITQMRTLETGRPMLRSTNTGVTTLVNAQGKVVSQLKPFVRGELDVVVQGYAGMTPYIRCGNYLWLGLMSLVALLSIGVHWRRRAVTASSAPAKTADHAAGC